MGSMRPALGRDSGSVSDAPGCDACCGVGDVAVAVAVAPPKPLRRPVVCHPVALVRGCGDSSTRGRCGAVMKKPTS